jgi:predicted branched-subunit amino acid permease
VGRFGSWVLGSFIGIFVSYFIAKEALPFAFFMTITDWLREAARENAKSVLIFTGSVVAFGGLGFIIGSRLSSPKRRRR